MVHPGLHKLDAMIRQLFQIQKQIQNSYSKWLIRLFWLPRRITLSSEFYTVWKFGNFPATHFYVKSIMAEEFWSFSSLFYQMNVDYFRWNQQFLLFQFRRRKSAHAQWTLGVNREIKKVGKSRFYWLNSFHYENSCIFQW